METVVGITRLWKDIGGEERLKNIQNNMTLPTYLIYMPTEEIYSTEI